jgi:glycosyltransferase involved in cell wall biosynthesis
VARAPYRIDFILIILTGNLTRYMLLRPLVEQAPEVESTWYPIRTWVADDWLRFLPGYARVRARHLIDAWPVLVKRPSDAILLHAFETYYLVALKNKFLRNRPVLVFNPDGGFLASADRRVQPLARMAIEQTDLFVPWSHWAASEMRTQFPALDESKVFVLHPGIDLPRWPRRALREPGVRFKLLFVAGAALLKGGDTVLAAVRGSLHDACELHLVTRSITTPAWFLRQARETPNVHLYVDLEPNSTELRRLYETCDALVHPTRADTSSWVALEALATGLPVIISPQGGIPEIVVDGRTGLIVPPDDPTALAAAVARLQSDTAFRRSLAAQGRQHVEQFFDAHKNTRALLDRIETLVDERRAAHP